jgi:thiol-disulfide isomerase/thioredoxin
VVLVAGLAIGLWRRRADGRLTGATGPAGAALAGSTGPAGPALAGSTGPAGPESAGPGPAGPAGPADPVAAAAGPGDRPDPALLAALGVEPGHLTLLQFSSAFCAPCRALRRVSSDVAGMVPGVRHVEVDAESHLDEVRALGIWRTPTLLILDRDGRIARRATGVPARPRLLAAVAELHMVAGR